MLEGLLSPMHLIIILAIGLLVLGPKRLPEAGRGIGSAMREFKNSISGSTDEPAAAVAPAAVETPAE